MIRPQRKCADTLRGTKPHCLSWVSNKLSLFRFRNRRRRRKTHHRLSVPPPSPTACQKKGQKGGEREAANRSADAIPALPAARAVQITRKCQRFDRLPTRYSLSSLSLTARFKALFVPISKFVFLEWEIAERRRMFSSAREGGRE